MKCSSVLLFVISGCLQYAEAKEYRDWLRKSLDCKDKDDDSLLCDSKVKELLDDAGVDPGKVLPLYCMSKIADRNLCNPEDTLKAKFDMMYDVATSFCLKTTGKDAAECKKLLTVPQLAASITSYLKSEIGKNTMNIAVKVGEEPTRELVRVAAQKAALIAAQASGVVLTPRHLGQIGRRAIEKAFPKIIESTGTSALTSATASTTFASSTFLAAAIGPAISGSMEAAYEMYNEGASTKVIAKFAQGSSAQAIGVGVGALICTPALGFYCGIPISLALNYGGSMVISWFYGDTKWDLVGDYSDQTDDVLYNRKVKSTSRPNLIFWHILAGTYTTSRQVKKILLSSTDSSSLADELLLLI